MRRRRFKTHLPKVAPLPWSVWKITPTGQELQLLDGATFEQAKRLGDELLQGLQPGERLSLREAITFGY